MFNNIGKKIKILAKIGAWCLLIGGIALGICFIAIEGEDLLGIIFMAIGLCAFFTAWPLYGFGQLIEDVSAIRENTELKRINGQPTGNANMFGDLPDL